MTLRRRRGIQNDCHHQNHFESQGTKRMLHVILLVFLVLLLICGTETFSFAVFPSVLYIRVNDTFEVSCFVEDNGGRLDFYDGNEFVPESFIKRINDSYIIYKNSCPKPTKKNITCKRADENIGISEIYIDEQFGPVNDFKCRTRDLKKLLCTFEKPFSYHPIHYRMQYTSHDGRHNICKLKPNLKGGYSCNITVDSDTSFFNFTLRAHNEFYKRIQKFQVHLLETLLPEPPINTTIRLPDVNETSLSESVLISIDLSEILQSIAKELMFHVKFKPMHENEWEDVYLTHFEMNNLGDISFALRNIKYANTIYQFKVRVKTKIAKDTDEMWSSYVEDKFKTKSKLPEMLPSTCENCYSVIDNGNVYLYWTEVPKFYQNGDNFSYVLKFYDPSLNLLINEVFTTKTSFMMSKELNMSNVEIHIYSCNQLGPSRNYTYVNVSTKRYKNMLSIKKEWIDENVGYKLSWKPYENKSDINGYTIIWCRQTSELPNQCDNSINYIKLPSNASEYYLATTESHQLGIVVNTISGNGKKGIQWSKCTSSRPNEIGVLNSIWTKYVLENSIQLEWSVNCADKDIISAYRIQYCVVADFVGNSCLTEENFDNLNVTGEEQNSNNYQISKLKPYRIYKISVSMISTSGRLGVPSKPIIIRTLEGSPTAPRNLRATEIQSDYVKLEWNKPQEVNGPSLTYQLWFNEKMIHIDKNETMNDTFEYHLKNLLPFTNYTITIVACTRKCSHSSESLALRTKIGIPSRVNDFYVQTFAINETLQLSWQKPYHLGGHLDFYLLIIEDFAYKIHSHRNSCIISLKCNERKISVSIRGVNVDSNNYNHHNSHIIDSENCFENPEEIHYDKYFYGLISETVVCGPKPYQSLFENPFIIIIMCVLMSVFLGLLCNLSYNVYSKLRDMKDIQVLLPNGLNSNITIKGNSDFSLSNFDLVQVCSNLEKIKEETFNEVELYDDENISEKVLTNKEKMVPLISKSQTFSLGEKDIFSDNVEKKSISVPSSPLKNEITVDNKQSGYIEMNKPVKSPKKHVPNPLIGGYLDMTVKNSNPYVHQNEIKNFIRNSQFNNGYIQRKITNNSSGYVGFKS